ncbi:MAG: ABC transporter permease [Fimbriimonadaceae bacterium]|nr:ABC transporter permease [Fimbriimonadaceae bacterium]
MSGFRCYRSVVRKEIVHLGRDTTSLVIALLIPLFQLTLFGFAIDFDVRDVRTVVVDQDRSRESAEYLTGLENTDYVEFVGRAATSDEATASLRRGDAQVAVIVPPGFGRSVAAGRSAALGVLIDGSDSQVAIRARQAFLEPSKSKAVEPRFDVLFNPTMRTETFMIPGLIAVILQIVTVSLTAFSLVREREQGTLEQLMVSPIGRVPLLLGKLTPYAGLAFAEMALVLAAGTLVFDVRVVGSLAALLLTSVPFILATLSMGLLISTIAQNQSQALQMTLLIMLPSILMSGFVFPRETMPGPLFLLSDALPVTHFLVVIRGIVVRGATLAEVGPSVGALLAITSVLVAASVGRFRKTLG